MKPRMTLTEEDCAKIMAAAVAEARKNNWVVAIAILDDGGHLLSFLRMDGAGPYSVDISQGKARTAALTRHPSKRYEDIIAGGRTAVLSMPLLSVQGALPIMAGTTCVGAVGVSGAASHEDEQVARAGIQALGPLG